VPHFPDVDAVARLLGRAREVLLLTQGELADMLGVARRTVSRWEGKESTPTIDQLRRLAQAVHTKDRALAAEIAVEGNASLEALGLVDRGIAAAAASIDGTVPSPRVFPPVDLLMDSVVHVAAQALVAQRSGDDPVAAVRAVLQAAFERARGLGLTMDEVAAVLSKGAQPARLATASPPSRVPKH
jgi:transcriptional regulator with XRE-family HTH domain